MADCSSRKKGTWVKHLAGNYAFSYHIDVNNVLVDVTLPTLDKIKITNFTFELSSVRLPSADAELSRVLAKVELPT